MFPAIACVDVAVGRVGGLRQQRGGGHDLPGLAVPALGDVDLLPRALERVAPVLREALDGGDARLAHRGDGSDAGAACLAVDQHGAGAALGDAAPELGALEVQSVPERPEERHVLRSLQRARLSVHLQLEFHEKTLAGEPNPALAPRYSRLASPCRERAPSWSSRRQAQVAPPLARGPAGCSGQRSGPAGPAPAGPCATEEQRSLPRVLGQRRRALELARPPRRCGRASPAGRRGRWGGGDSRASRGSSLSASTSSSASAGPKAMETATARFSSTTGDRVSSTSAS